MLKNYLKKNVYFIILVFLFNNFFLSYISFQLPFLNSILLKKVFAEDLGKDDLFKADEPIFYGKENFINRIEKIRENKKDHKIIALHLSGGSARAFAHIGVLKRLNKENIRPDVIIANSMGSIIGLLYAAGLDIDVIENLFKSFNLGNLFNPVFPVNGGVLDVSNFISIIYSLIGEKDISDLDIPVVIVCEDLKTKRKVYLTKGNFYKVLKASFALPVYFSPQKLDKFLLIDGGITNLVPMKDLFQLFDVNIVATTFYNKKLNLKNPITIVNVGFDIGKRRNAIKNIKKFKPFLIRCNVEHYSFMDWDKIDEIIKKGYNSTDLIIFELKKYLSHNGIKLNNYVSYKSSNKSYEKNNKYFETKYSEKLILIKKKIICDYYFYRNESEYNFGYKYINYNNYFNKHTLLDPSFHYVYYNLYKNYFNFYSGIIFNKEKLTGLVFRFSLNPSGYLHFNFESLIYYNIDFLSLDNFNFDNFSIDKFKNYNYYVFSMLNYKNIIFNRIIIDPYLSYEITNVSIFTNDLFKIGFNFEFYFSNFNNSNIKEINIKQFNYLKIKNMFFYYDNYFKTGINEEIIVNKKILNNFYTNLRINYKTNFLEDNSIYYNIKDFFRGIDYKIRLNSYLIENFDLGIFLFKKSYTFAETLIVKNFKISLFFDSIFINNIDSGNIYENKDFYYLNNYITNCLLNEYFNIFTYSTGIDIKFEISLIGLKPFNINFMIGYFPLTGKFFYKFILN